MERRALIQWLVATAGLQCLDSLAPADLFALGRDVHRGAAHPGPRTLVPHAERTVAAAAERIIPATDTAGRRRRRRERVHRQDAPPIGTRRPSGSGFLAGLPELDARCRARASRDFTDGTADDQVAVLTALDEEVTALRSSQGDAVANRHWFAMLKYLTVYGYCTSEPGARALGLTGFIGRYDGCAAR